MREAVAALRWRERETTDTTIRPYLTSLRAALEGDREKSLAALGGSATLPIDAEALYYLARTFARLGAGDRAVVELRPVVDGGFWCYDALIRDRWLDPIRSRPEARAALEECPRSRRAVRATFVESDGETLLVLT